MTPHTENRPVTAGSNGAKPADRLKNYWTIMIYHSGDSDLGEEFVWAMKEMFRVGTPDRVEVVALMDSVSQELWKFTIPAGTAGVMAAGAAGKRAEGKPVNGDPSAGGQELSLFHEFKGRAERVTENSFATETPDSQSGAEKKTGVKEKKKHGANMASARFLQNFVASCVVDHPANHYMLILGGHGDGTIGKTLLLDRGADRFLSVPRLNWALHGIINRATKSFADERTKQITEQDTDPRIDILGLDACVMMSAEVAHLLSEEVQYLVASQGYMTMTGWPYYEILEYLNKEPNAAPDELASEVVRRCIRYYTDYAHVGVSIDLAACRLDKEGWDGLTAAVKALANRLHSAVKDELTVDTEQPGKPRSRRFTNAVIASHWYAQSYASEQYVDLRDFCEQLVQAAPELEPECEPIIRRIDGLVDLSCYAGAAFQHSNGVSLYFPWVATHDELARYMSVTKENRKSADSTDLEWGDFLNFFIDATRREPRGPKNDQEIDMPPDGYLDHIPDLLNPSHSRTGTLPNIRGGVPTNNRNGVMPNIRNGVLPNIRNGVLPNIRNGVLPNIRNGVLPNIRNGVLPNIRNGVLPNIRNGVLPNIRNGVLPNIRGMVILPKVKNPALFSFEDKRAQELAETAPEATAVYSRASAKAEEERLESKSPITVSADGVFQETS